MAQMIENLFTEFNMDLKKRKKEKKKGMGLKKKCSATHTVGPNTDSRRGKQSPISKIWTRKLGITGGKTQ